MTWTEIVIIAWLCGACGVDVAVGDGDVPDRWPPNTDSESHACPHCGTLRDGR